MKYVKQKSILFFALLCGIFSFSNITASAEESQEALMYIEDIDESVCNMSGYVSDLAHDLPRDLDDIRTTLNSEKSYLQYIESSLSEVRNSFIWYPNDPVEVPEHIIFPHNGDYDNYMLIKTYTDTFNQYDNHEDWSAISAENQTLYMLVVCDWDNEDIRTFNVTYQTYNYCGIIEYNGFLQIGCLNVYLSRDCITWYDGNQIAIEPEDYAVIGAESAAMILRKHGDDVYDPLGLLGSEASSSEAEVLDESLIEDAEIIATKWEITILEQLRDCKIALVVSSLIMALTLVVCSTVGGVPR